MLDHTLSITSPLTEGSLARYAQQVLNGSNVLGTDYLRGPVDGVFGELTGRACIRAKYLLGYPTADLRPTYGQQLDRLLKGQEQPSAEMLRRQELRQEQAAERPLRELALAEALRHLGVKESPAGSNKVLFSDWYGIRGPWCAMFVTYCYEAGAKDARAFARGQHYAYVPYLVADARAGRRGLQVIRDPKPGDVVCYDWDGGVADHVGLFEKWVSGRSIFSAVEGNTGVGNDSNGGEVMRRPDRKPSLVECFVRVGR